MQTKHKESVDRIRKKAKLSEDMTTIGDTDEVDLMNVLVDDPKLLEYKDLVTKYTPKSILERYAQTAKRHRLRILPEIGSNGEHICKASFFTPESGIPASGTDPQSIYMATERACQKLCTLVFPKHPIWVDLVNYVNGLPLLPPKSVVEEAPKKSLLTTVQTVFKSAIEVAEANSGLVETEDLSNTPIIPMDIQDSDCMIID